MVQVPVVALDIAHKLLVDDQVVICKMNPVNAWAGPYIRYTCHGDPKPCHAPKP